MRRSAKTMTFLQSLASFRRAQDGHAAVEFAIVAAPFFFMLFAMMELAIVFTISTTLDDGVVSAARRVRTGQLQTAGGANITTFKNDVCARMTWLEDHCQSHLSVDVRTYAQWANATPPNPIQTDGTFNSSALTFAPGGPGDIVMVRGYYRWTLFTPFLSQALGKLSNNEAVVTATAAFRNEPYDE
jgi:Flp pilus assembly protein TadG